LSPPELTETGAADSRQSPLSAGATLLLCFILSLAAIVARTPLALGLLTAVNGVLLLVQGCERRTLLRGIRLLLLQGGVVTGLYLLRYGFDGLLPGLRVSWQLLLVFVPGLFLLNGTATSSLARALGRLLPARSAFVLAVSLKFLPLLLAEISAIYEAQLLRGARIQPRDLLFPRNWPDLFLCLIAPAVVQALELADNIARAARAREFGHRRERTCWPGDQELES
jgi:energy-coupling factor transport system permease protein